MRSGRDIRELSEFFGAINQHVGDLAEGGTQAAHNLVGPKRRGQALDRHRLCPTEERLP